MIRCPYCERLIKAGVVTIKGERYYCSHCVVWFKMKNNKLIKTDFIVL